MTTLVETRIKPTSLQQLKMLLNLTHELTNLAEIETVVTWSFKARDMEPFDSEDLEFGISYSGNIFCAKPFSANKPATQFSVSSRFSREFHFCVECKTPLFESIYLVNHVKCRNSKGRLFGSY